MLRHKPRLLDLFCCAGGASVGYARAGFDVVGVDRDPQPHYPFEFVQCRALDLDPTWVLTFDAIHASPPCQAHTAMKTMYNAKPHVDMIPQTRAMLIASGLPYVIENVIGAPLVNAVVLCGTMFGLGVSGAELRRHRQFETSFGLVPPSACRHLTRLQTIGIYGEGCRNSKRKFDKTIPEFSVDQGRQAMGIDWMTLAELSQALPPAYTQYIGFFLYEEIERIQGNAR